MRKERKEIYKKNLMIIVLIVIIFLLLYFFIFIFPQYSKKRSETKSVRGLGSNFLVCTGAVDQPECFEDEFPTPKIKWKFSSLTSEQIAFQVQIDNNKDFSSLEIDSGNIKSSENFYIVDREGLKAGENYYWRIKLEDNLGIWSDWVEGDNPIQVVEYCK